MQIVLGNNPLKEYILGVNKLIWKSYSRKVVKLIIPVFFLGIIFLVLGILFGQRNLITTDKLITTTNEQYIAPITHYNYDFHVTFGLGISFVFLAAYFAFIYFVNQKKSFFRPIEKKAQRIPVNNDTYLLSITDDAVAYQDFEINWETKWSNFAAHKIDNGYLLLMPDNSSLNCIAIDMSRLKANEQEELLQFVKGRLVTI